MKILMVDDNRDFAAEQCEWLKEEGYRAIRAHSERDARKSLAENGEEIDVALIDMYMEAPDSGLKLIKLIGERYPQIVPIVITGHADFENAARCMEEGCFSYIVKGETPPNVIRQTIEKATEYYKLRVSYRQLWNTMPRLKQGLTTLRGQFAELTKTMKQVSDTLRRVEDELSLLRIPGKSAKSNPSEERDSDGK
jgi:DNA-binding NtrC family response regulator